MLTHNNIGVFVDSLKYLNTQQNKKYKTVKFSFEYYVSLGAHFLIFLMTSFESGLRLIRENSILSYCPLPSQKNHHNNMIIGVKGDDHLLYQFRCTIISFTTYQLKPYQTIPYRIISNHSVMFFTTPSYPTIRFVG